MFSVAPDDLARLDALPEFKALQGRIHQHLLARFGEEVNLEQAQDPESVRLALLRSVVEFSRFSGAGLRYTESPFAFPLKQKLDVLLEMKDPAK
ncbi:hypothetical protein RZS08_49895, partial [Arthrospira platensis SPKY1]|nr:hypothetical protein [Arthrospira platensis SPKY1]